ncbi:hypothetical protein IW140_000658 [Coemansia sp. RSA 1813]|nr:hypothetical protein EV178_000836 [Coemansia sp. RSA 1646]KAJ1773837.1 hypothetical protein LPJ74_000381 [Coemansia sp. RSA 1843]KAJ2092457.1 hypothetical protein IW138_001219 [Coemansia sp. RSA 986]KAJ2217319.1 hypothetical protein EV179_000469 [Coemansia sp. RSA 487]KAJ2572543.1 hypothetical protein IW140_000658 [Coemansia sp. RSA 1813]
MFSLAARLAKNSCVAAPLARGVATTGGGKSFGKGQQQADGSSSALRAKLRKKVDHIVEPIAETPAVVYESSRYKKRFHPKTIYHPSELNDGNETKVFPKTLDERPVLNDPFKSLGIDPLRHYKNTAMLAHFITDMGKIRPRKKSLLSAKSQNRVAKAIKRARAFGLLPLVSKPGSAYNYNYLGRGSIGNP